MGSSSIEWVLGFRVQEIADTTEVADFNQYQ
jgi:hypothetical protein